MTDFEQQVAAALAAHFHAMRLDFAGRPDDHLRWSATDLATDLAPRVAAAIQKAAARGVNLGVMEPHLPNGLAEARQEALQVLRGSGETHQP